MATIPRVDSDKEFNICLVGSGGVGTIAALVLEKSGRAKVTAVLRSSYSVVNEKGWDIESVDHGPRTGWTPSRGEFDTNSPSSAMPISAFELQ
jgi:ketopantoate reductase